MLIDVEVWNVNLSLIISFNATREKVSSSDDGLDQWRSKIPYIMQFDLHHSSLVAPASARAFQTLRDIN